MKNDFLQDRLAPAQCSKCNQHKIITVKFGDEKICKTCLDDISEEIGNRVAEELSGAEVSINPMAIPSEVNLEKINKSEIISPPKKKRGRPPKKPAGQSSFSQDELEQMGQGAKQAEPLGVAPPAPKPTAMPGISAGWRK